MSEYESYDMNHDDPALVEDLYWPTSNSLPRKAPGLAVSGRSWNMIHLNDLETLIGDILSDASEMTFSASLRVYADQDNQIRCDFKITSTEPVIMSLMAINRKLIAEYIQDLTAEADKELSLVLVFHHAGWFWTPEE